MLSFDEILGDPRTRNFGLLKSIKMEIRKISTNLATAQNHNQTYVYLDVDYLGMDNHTRACHQGKQIRRYFGFPSLIIIGG